MNTYERGERDIKSRVAAVFDCRNIAEMSRRTGIPRSTLQSWRRDPLKIRAVDLIVLEAFTGTRA